MLNRALRRRLDGACPGPELEFAPEPAILGNWDLVKYLDDGTDRMRRLAKGVGKIVVTPTEIYLVDPKGKKYGPNAILNLGWKSYKRDRSKSPQQITIDKAGDKAATYLGIYKVERDELTIAYAETRGSFTFDGPKTSEPAKANPFRDYRLTMTFEHEASKNLYRVPGYYAAPFAFPHDVNGRLTPWTPTRGEHTLIMTPYEYGDGTPGVPAKLQFEIEE